MGGMQGDVTRRTATWMAITFVFIVPWENVIVIPGLGTLARVAGLGLFGLFALSVAAKGTLRRPTQFHILAAAFAVWGITSVAWSSAFAISTLFSITLIQLVLIAYLLYNLLDNPLAHYRARVASVLGGYIVSAILIFNGVTGNVTEFERRASIPNSNENDVGIVLVLLMPIAWHLANDRGVSKLIRSVSVFYIPLAFVGIIFTASRTSLVVALLFVVMAMASLMRAGRIQKLLYPLILAATAAFVAVSAPETSFERLGTIQGSVEQGDFGSRQFFWAKAWELISEGAATTLFGFGLGTFDFLVGDSAHQTFLAVTAELGIVGLGLLLSVLIIVGRHIRTLDSANRQMWTSAMIIWLIAVQTLSWHFFTFTWVLFALIMADGSWKAPATARTSDSDGPVIDLRTPARQR